MAHAPRPPIAPHRSPSPVPPSSSDLPPAAAHPSGSSDRPAPSGPVPWLRSSRRRSTGVGRRLAALAAVLALAVTAGCSSDDGGASGGSTTAAAGSSTSTTEPAGAVEPEEVAASLSFEELIDVDLADYGAGEHGDLLRYQPVPLPDPLDGDRYRILYRSVTPSGKPTFVTGMLTVPPGDAPDDGWGLISHAHGSTGLADDCAPSAKPDGLGSVEASLVQSTGREHGYAVVSTDYEGQGGPGRHPFLNGVSEGRSVLDAARAARQVPGVELTPTATGLAGYSQGGHAILWANQLAEAWTPELEIIGTVSGAPASELEDAATGEVFADGGAVLLFAGLATDEHEAELDDLLTDAGRKVLETAERSCTAAQDRSLRGAEFFTVDPLTTEPWKDLLAENTPGASPGASPVLIVHGDADVNVPAELSVALMDRLCASGDVVERRVAPGLDHIAGAIPTYQQGIAWLDDLATGTEPTDACPG